MKTRISGKEAARVAEDMAKPGPTRLVDLSEAQEAPSALVPSPGSELDRKVPPRVRKPLPRNDQWKAPTPDLEGHRQRLREAFGNTLSDEFVDVILGKLVEALRPGLYDQLEEATLNAALATIDSMQPRSELQALLAVEIVATGFAGLRFFRQSHRNMTEDYINVYGGYGIKLLRLQNELIQTFERYRRGNKQTVEVRHVHIHSGGQGVVGIINSAEDRAGGVHEDRMSRKTKSAFVGEVSPRRPPVRVRTRRITANVAKLHPPDGEGKIWWGRLKKALGTGSSDFVNASLHQLQAAAQFPGSGISETGINAALAMIEGFAPQNEVEAALAVQMACTHIATMSVLARLGPGVGPEDRAVRLASAVARLVRAFTNQFEAYRRLRHGGDQYVRVEHVHINEGAQAVIGNVHPHESGRAQLPEKQIRRYDDDEGAAP
jgi:hypothetical protein